MLGNACPGAGNTRRHGQLPLAKVSAKHSVPTHAIAVVAALTLALGLAFAPRSGNGITLLSSLINFGAMSAFLVLHVAVVWHYGVRQRSRNIGAHWVAPMLGFAILLYVVINANIAAQALGLAWLGLGLLVLLGLYLAGRRPVLSGLNPIGERA